MEDGKSITLSDDETAKLKALVELYSRNAKPYILYSEQIDPDSKSNLQVIKEQRDALDHLMRFFSEKFDNSSAINGDYCLTHLSKSKGHLYRAAFDALDGATLSLKLKISQIVNNYSLEVILAVIKNYGEIKLKLEKLNERIASYRNSKDIGDDKSLELMESYASDIDEMKEYYATILGLEKDLHKLNTDKANNEKSNKRFNIWLSVSIAIISLIAGYLISFLTK